MIDSGAGNEKWLSGSFSPDGMYITNASTLIVNRQQRNAEVHVMRIDGTDARNVTDEPKFWDSSPEWGPAI